MAIDQNGFAGDQHEVLAFLGNPASHGGKPVECVQTHGNYIFLSSDEAWKIKRAVRLPYLDFSTLAKRQAACAREFEVNRHFAPDLYLGCVAIRRSTSGTLCFGGTGPIVEWAVHMRRFEQAALLSKIAATGVTDDLARALAEVVFAAHRHAPAIASKDGSSALLRLVDSVTTALVASDAIGKEQSRSLTDLMRQSLRSTMALLDERALEGFVRRCHGDLHLANIVVWQGKPVLYDAVEFDEAIATVDVLYDLAFLLMDLEKHNQPRAANIGLNRYLLLSGADADLNGLAALPLFLALRAAVRAMVTLDKLALAGVQHKSSEVTLAQHYVASALEYLNPPPARLVAVGGFSGTGKTTLAAALAPTLGAAPGALHLRSDLERKVRAGVAEFDHMPDTAYSPSARKEIYRALEHKAGLALAAGHSVVVDAVYTDATDREAIEAVAHFLQVPFNGIWLVGEPDLLAARIAARTHDASDATAATIMSQAAGGFGKLTPQWTQIPAAGPPEDICRATKHMLGLPAANQ
jgi:uncharacterized protein